MVQGKLRIPRFGNQYVEIDMSEQCDPCVLCSFLLVATITDMSSEKLVKTCFFGVK